MSNRGGESVGEGHEPWLFLPRLPGKDGNAGAKGKTFKGFYGGVSTRLGKILRGVRGRTYDEKQ